MENRISQFFGCLEEAIQDRRISMEELREIAGHLNFPVDIEKDDRSTAVYSLVMEGTSTPVAHFVDSRTKKETIERLGYDLVAGVSLNNMDFPESVDFGKLRPHIRAEKQIVIRLQKPTAIDPVYYAELYLPKV